MKIKNIFRKLHINKNKYSDIHLMRYYSSFVAVSQGRVLELTKPHMAYCPLANYLYKGVLTPGKYDEKKVKDAIKTNVENKIAEFGFFTNKREIVRKDITVPFGASEILMYCLKKKIIDVAVVVCDGAGTVIVNNPEVVQGIGARMNGLFYTTPIEDVIKKLEKKGCTLISSDSQIDQIKGIETAVSLGYKKIAVTINGCMENDLKKIKKIEDKFGISVTVLIVCTTDIDKKTINQILKHGDIVWSCASCRVREIIGKKSILQLSEAIPVFVLTSKGLELAIGYCSDKRLLNKLNDKKQYLISGKNKNGILKQIKMGNYNGYLSKTKLPVRSTKEPVLTKKGAYKQWNS